MTARSHRCRRLGREEFRRLPGPGNFDLPPVFSRSLSSASPSRCSCWSSPRVLVFGFFYARLPQAVDGPRASCSSPASRPTASSATASPATSSARRDFHEVRALAGGDVLLHPGQQLVRHHPVHPVPDVLPGRLRLRRSPALVWILYNGVGIDKHGFGRLPQARAFPPASPARSCSLIVPLEFFSTILVRPVTLALRLFANMFAGHLLLILFALGGEYLISTRQSCYKPRRRARLRPRHRHQLPGALGPVPAGLRVHPAHRDVHPGALADEH